MKLPSKQLYSYVLDTETRLDILQKQFPKNKQYLFEDLKENVNIYKFYLENYDPNNYEINTSIVCFPYYLYDMASILELEAL